MRRPVHPERSRGTPRTTFFLLVLAGCVTAPATVPVRPVPPPEVLVPVVDTQSALREIVQAFIDATEARKFEEVRALLARPLRERYSAKTLERDYGADPQASERVAQIKKSTANLVESRDSAVLEWSEGRSLRLVREPDGWRISALE